MVVSAIPEALDEWRDVIHPAALLLPRPSPTEYADLKASIEDRGVLTPLATFIDAKGEHWLLDGLSRLQVMVELGITVLNSQTNEWAVPTTAYREDKGDDPYAIALSLNVSRRHLNVAQRRQLIADLRAQRPDLTDRAIARMAGTSHSTVAAVRHESEDEAADTVEDAAEEETVQAGEDTADGETEPTPVIVEESGRRARGRPARTREEREVETRDRGVRQLGGGPFIGKVLPTDARPARIAEARRCIKWLGLEPEDVMPRRRRETVH